MGKMFPIIIAHAMFFSRFRWERPSLMSIGSNETENGYISLIKV